MSQERPEATPGQDETPADLDRREREGAPSDLDQQRREGALADLGQQRREERLQMLLGESEQRAHERVERLQRVTAALSRAVTPGEIGELVVHDGLRLLGGDAAMLFVASPDGLGLDLLSHDGMPDELLRIASHLPVDSPAPTAISFREGRALFVESPEEYARLYPESAATRGRLAGVAAFVLVPLLGRGGERLGVASLSFRTPHAFAPADRAFVLALADLCAQALERARLFEAERQARAAAEEASRLKDEFIATVSHELRTPLAAIVGWASLLRGTKAGDPAFVAKAIDVIDRNARAQARLIDDILDVSRIVTGKLKIEPEPADLGAIVREAVDNVRHAADVKGVALDVRADEGPHRLVGDPGRLHQIAWNLLTNAVRYTDRGGLITVEVRRTSDALTLTVRDTGQGITHSFLPFVFERFRQADGSTTRPQGGLGLGLSIVRHIAELHGGTVRAESEGPGKGAIFTVSFPTPARPSASSPPLSLKIRAVDEGPNDPDHPLVRVRILTVDDSPDARSLFEAIFTSAGASVFAATSTDEALSALESFRPDVLVSDIGLPDKDGFDLLRAIRALPAPWHALPAIAVTAYARPEDAALALAAGFARHVPKPAGPVELIDAVRSVLAAD